MTYLIWFKCFSFTGSLVAAARSRSRAAFRARAPQAAAGEEYLRVAWYRSQDRSEDRSAEGGGVFGPRNTKRFLPGSAKPAGQALFSNQPIAINNLKTLAIVAITASNHSPHTPARASKTRERRSRATPHLFALISLPSPRSRSNWQITSTCGHQPVYLHHGP